MEKHELDKEYLNWETDIKRKELIYMNYAIGGMCVLEALGSYQNLGKIVCWEHTLYFYYFPWAFFGMKFVLKYVSFETGAFINANYFHIGTYITLLTKNNYIAIIISYIIHFHMRSIFLTNPTLFWLDNGLITGFLGLTFHRMMSELFDNELKCTWDYKIFQADVQDSVSRLIMLYMVLYFADYLTKKKIEWMKNMADKIEDKSKEKERFFACISHELRNPLNSLLASVEILPITPIWKQGEILSAAKTCGETLLHLIGNILDVSKIKDKKMEIYLTDTDITELINKVTYMHKIKAQNKGLYYDIIQDPNVPPCVKLDSGKFTQVLTNLISNSIKFTERGSVITKISWIPIHKPNYTNEDFELAIEETGRISNREDVLNCVIEEDVSPTSKRKFDLNKKLRLYDGKPMIKQSVIVGQTSPGPWIDYMNSPLMTSQQSPIPTPHPQRSAQTKDQGVLKLEIIDSGIGISAKNAKSLFKPFAQADKTISKNFGGTGLGLWIAKSIMEIMGGCIKIESELGQGSNFMIILPLFSGDEESVLNEKNIDMNILQNIYRGLRILYVEDISENQMVMSHVLSELGFEINLANNGAEGFYQFKKNGVEYFDLILTDLRMPTMSGQTMIMKIREYEEKCCLDTKIPIIVLTGDPSENERDKCLNILKADSFLVKPVSILQLTGQLSKIFSSPYIEQPLSTKRKNKKVILIVEDETLLNNLVKHFLSDYEVLQAFSVEEGIQKFKDNYDRLFVVCLDGNLKDGMGVDFLRPSRQFEKEKGVTPAQQVKLISTSGDSRNILEILYRNLHIDKFLEKPFSKDTLLKAVQELEDNN